MIFEYGLPKRKICNNKQEFLKIVNANNGIKKAIYRTIYNFEKMNGNKPDYNTAIIDKIFFDFDGENSWQEANKLHQELKKENLKHRINMSGGGYHIFLFTNNYIPKNPKSCLYNAQIYFINKINLNCDKAIIGDIARLYRVENTYNAKRKRFCIPLKESEFEKGDEYCKELAKKQHFIKPEIIGEKLLELKKFDFNSKEDTNVLLEKLESTSSENVIARWISPCIKELLKKKDLNYKERYLVILYFKESGYTKKEVLKILKEHLSEKKFKHCIFEEKQLQYLFNRDDLMFPSCEKIKKDGYCVDGEECSTKRNHNIYK